MPQPSDRPTLSPVLSRRAFLAGALAGLSGLALAGCGAQGAAPAGSARAAGAAGSMPVITDAAADVVKTASFMMVGDVLVHQKVWESGQRQDGSMNFDHIFAHVGADVKGVDVAMLNQETILGGTQLGLKSYPLFNSPQEMGDAEAAAGFDVALAATNHAADAGMAGIESELRFWREKHPEVRCIGIQDSQEAYDAVDILTVNGIKIAVLNHTFSLNGLAAPAPYAVRMLEEQKFAADYQRARAEGAQVVVEVPHWGTEYVYQATDYQRQWAQRFADAGVDAVIGAHPHVLEPVEVVTGSNGHKTLVFWSLGNFVSCQTEKPRMLGGMAKVTFEVRAAADGKGAGTASVKEWSLEPVVTHIGAGTAFTTYKLSDYPAELAAKNGILGYPGGAGFSRAFCDDLAAQILGDGYDRGACRLAGGAL